ncbi:MAG: 50S ribosomal protein L9 [Deltaproteobacteria bacterium]|nr:50S ribosomal protein L9 [Deltaproteobacteria bacterium]
MKVILKDDMENLGGFGDTVKVADGYARNYLIPRGLAVRATTGNLRSLEAQKEARQSKMSKLKEDADRLKCAIETVSLSFSRKAGEDGRLFGSVTSMDIEGALREKGYNVDKKVILLDESIKALGDFTVTVKLHPEVKAGIKVSVAAE